MSQEHKEPLVYRSSYQLTLLLCRYVKDMNQDYKLSIGLVFQKEALEFLHSVYRVNDQDDKEKAIKEVISKLYFLRTNARLLLDLGAMKLETNTLINDHLENVLSQLIAWRKN